MIKTSFKCKNTAPGTSVDFYKFIRLIGKGAFGKVHLGLQILTGKYVAIKCIDKILIRNEMSK